MKVFLDGFLPRLLPPEVRFETIAHQGKDNLHKKVPLLLRSWRRPDTRFVVIRDQDQGPCAPVKKRIVDLCHLGGRPDTLVRIACRELEAWFLGDLEAVAQAFDQPRLLDLIDSRADPDGLQRPSALLAARIPGYRKTDGARRMAAVIDPGRCRSESLGQLIAGLERLLGCPLVIR